MYKVIQTIEETLGHVKTRAQNNEDGNTVAIIDRMLRDLNQMQPEYRELTFEDVHPLATVSEESEDAEEGEGIDLNRVSGGKAFTPASYEKTAAQDVTPKAYPPTGEEADAPFVSKSDVENGENLSEEKSSGTKQGKVARAGV